MPNERTERYNALIDSAEELYGYLSGSYMDALDGRMLDCGDGRIPVGGMQFVEVCGYRKLADGDATRAQVRRTVAAAMEVCRANDCAFAWLAASVHSDVRLFFAFETDGDSPVGTLLENGIPGAEIRRGGLSAAELRAVGAFGGVISDDTEVGQPVADGLVEALRRSGGILCRLCVPVPPEETEEYRSGLLTLDTRAEAVLSQDFSYHSGARHTYKKVFDGVEKLHEYIGARREAQKKTAQPQWKSCIWFAAPTAQGAQTLGQAAAGVLNAANTRPGGRARCFYTTAVPFGSGELGLPTANYFQRIGIVPEELRRPSLLTAASSDVLADAMQLPLLGYPGFGVVDRAIDRNSLRDFSSNTPADAGQGLLIGTDAYTGTSYRVPFRAVTEHLLVTGATGSGKTNTVMGRVRALWRAGYPVCIIEPAKKDYWRLISEIPELRVFSAGGDAPPLRFNPMIPEEGVIIGNHVDALMYAFSGAFEMEEPTRLALDGLLKYAYERFGWALNEVAFPKGKRWPTLTDVRDLIGEYCDRRLVYGREVGENIRGALRNRLNTLTSGTVGGMLSGDGLSGRTLCTGAVLIELDDLSLDTKPFAAGLLLMKLDQYLRRRETADGLKNVIVLEEAHNVFGAPSEGAHSVSRDQASRFFANMLSQIRGYGAGIIIADQSVARLHPTAVANTRLKIAHAVARQREADEIAYALGLTEDQKALLPTLRTGEAVVSARGQAGASKVRIAPASPQQVRNCGCLFCAQRRLCAGAQVRQAAERLGYRRMTYAQRLYDVRYDAARLRAELAAAARQLGLADEWQPCLLGVLLEDLPCGALERRRTLYTFAYDMI